MKMTMSRMTMVTMNGEDDVRRGGEEGEERRGWRCPKNNKNPTLRMWGKFKNKKSKKKTFPGSSSSDNSKYQYLMSKQ